MINHVFALNQMSDLNLSTQIYCRRYSSFRAFVNSNESVGRTCSFVNLIKYVLRKYFETPIDDIFIRRYRGIYAFSFRVIAKLNFIYKFIGRFTLQEIRVLVGWTLEWQYYHLPN